jgi:peptidoglycan hydrolase CwlO-like protein
VLAPFGAVSVEDLIQKAKQKLSENSADLNQTAQSFEDRARAFYEKSKRGR